MDVLILVKETKGKDKGEFVTIKAKNGEELGDCEMLNSGKVGLELTL